MTAQRIRIGWLVVGVLMVASCEVPLNAITIVNRLDHNVRVVERLGSAEGVVRPTLGPGVTTKLRDDCIDGDLVAISSVTNEEVDRRPGPICQGDDPWIIDGVEG